MKTFKQGEPINVRLNEEFGLCLQALGAAGYEWQVLEKSPGLAVLESSFSPSTEGQIGGPSQQTLRFRGDQPGSHQLRLVCKRTWDTTPGQTLTVPVTVHDRA